MEKKEKRKFNYNVVIIALCFMMVLFGLGLWGAKSLFVVPITSALNITRGAYSLADTMRYAATAIVNIFFGYLVGKLGSKKLICAGFIALLGAALCYALASNVWVLYIGGMLLGVGLSWTSTTIVGYIVNKACKENRGTIMGFVLAANGIGGALASLIVSPLINQEGNPFGYRNAYFLMAGVFVVMFFLLLIFYKEPSAPEGETGVPKKKARGTGWIGIEYSQALKKTYFYSACLCIFLTGVVLQGVTSISAAHMTDVGLDAEYVAVVTSVLSIALALFKFLNGFMYDRLGLRITITIDCLAALGVMTCLYFITDSVFGMVLAMVYAVLAGIALPLETVMLPIYANDLFGDKSFNKVLGIFVSVNQVGYALGAPLLNLLYDWLRSYNVALILCACLVLFIVITLQFVITSAQKVKKQVVQSAE